MSTAATHYVVPTDRLIAFATALLLHGIVIVALWFSIQTTPPDLTGIKQSFEMVDLTAYLKRQQMTIPVPAPASTQAETEPVSVPIPVQEIPEPLPEVKVAKAVPPKPKPKPEPKPKPKSKPRSEPKPPIAKPVATNSVEPAAETKDTAIQNKVTTEKESYIAPSSYAAYLDNPKPSYPRIAKLRGMEGIVKLRVKVGIDGQPVTVDLQQSSGFSALDDAAIKVVRHWRFEPARRAGIKVAGEAIVPIQFKLNKV
ncbi:MAG: energy transducer TonB [Gammaproteobacteria bacterium]|nr:energy transducer TonB [Gammaproteobacteria bacterium]